MMQDTPYDSLEVRHPPSRDAAFWTALQQIAAHAKAQAPAWRERLARVSPSDLCGPEALAQIPVLRKGAMLELQRQSRAVGGDVFGGHATIGWSSAGTKRQNAARVFSSPGPIYEPQGPGSDYWRMARALHAAGLRRGDLLHNSFSYHFTPAGAMLEGGAHLLGCTVFPAGIGQTEQQLLAMAELGADAYCGTPSFLGILLDRATTMGVTLPRLRKALVSGEALSPALSNRLGAAGVSTLQCYATADIGLIAYETQARDGMFLDESIWVEILDPNDRPVADGEVGEVVVTVLNPDYPLLRFGTGDLSAIIPESRTQASSCGRTQLRIRGWMGRADQATKIRGLFVHPQQVQDILRRHPQLLRARIEVSQRNGEDLMTLHCECALPSAELAQAVQHSVRECTKLRADVQWHPPGDWPEDARQIVDARQIRAG